VVPGKPDQSEIYRRITSDDEYERMPQKADRLPEEMLWRKQAGELCNRLLEAKTPTARFHVLEQGLLAQIARRGRRHPAVAFALKGDSNCSWNRRVSRFRRAGAHRESGNETS